MAAPISIITNKSLDHYKRAVFQKYLDTEGLTEIAVNRPHEVWTEINGEWVSHKDDAVTLDFCQRFSRTLASFKKDEISEVKPMLSATLESGERVQVVFPPACEPKTVSITIRKPSIRQIPHSEYVQNGFYRYVSTGEKKKNVNDELKKLYQGKKISEFLELAVKAGKTVVIAGGTGSGKTTYMKSLIDFIPLDIRLMTIEDTEEIKFYIHKNYVHLFYPSEAGTSVNAIITAGTLVKSCYRMKPDRILLAEVRGGEAWDFIKIVGSGHNGSMTSIHAGSVREAIEGLVERCYQNTECHNLPYDVLKKKVLESIDIILQVNREGRVRYLNEIYYKDVDNENV
ncbi:P-type DNA transfer ATPase VirB11 [Xenorhabdus entomophaga]|uniref:P-type DNA transfer ATPase VirB11 n=1 Tax=Xenorhabdus entomophaga TaxID=3136257 RepID=UPI0030F3AB97